MGRFISPDTVVQSLGNPQSLNRYSYVFNNPLKYTDPTGNTVEFDYDGYDLLDMEDEELTGEFLDAFLDIAEDWIAFDEANPGLVGEMERSEDVYSVSANDEGGIDITRDDDDGGGTEPGLPIEGGSGPTGTGYGDITIQLGRGAGVTGGATFSRNENVISTYFYGGGGYVSTSGCSLTASAIGKARPGWTIAIQIGYGAGYQVGWSLGKGGGLFFETGLSTPNLSITIFHVSNPINIKLPWWG
ncbi:RHS repeat-associated core domain-containing protein [Chloroflexota bacterium]